ncbi:hypothetical protein IWW34DRAFT_902374 [Fusarium oxysporum f. sp. albedinis]|nr:hypothetical protein IWW34DRAFT_902374 [Fusarium oxysporum f. sp. albedinis]
MTKKGCPLSQLLCPTDTNTPTSEPSPTSKATPFVIATSSSQSLGRAGSDCANPPSLQFTPTCLMNIDASSHRQAVGTAVPQATLPSLYNHQQQHPAAYANSSLVLASPAPQESVVRPLQKRPLQKRPLQHGDDLLAGDKPFDHYSSPFVPAKESGTHKKRNTRASQACESCRQRKVKCDETRPCKSCQENGTGCIYSDPAPKVTNRAQARLSARVDELEQRFDEFEA